MEIWKFLNTFDKLMYIPSFLSCSPLLLNKDFKININFQNLKSYFSFAINQCHRHVLSYPTLLLDLQVQYGCYVINVNSM